MLSPKRRALLLALTTAGVTLAGLHSVPSRAEQAVKQAEPKIHQVATSPLAVTIEVQPHSVNHDYGFDVFLCVTNTSSTVQHFDVYNCSWEEHWRSSNPRVGPADGWGCRANCVQTLELHPGDKYQRTLRIRRLHPEDKTKPISFQMGFTPYASKRTYWSNEATLPAPQFDR